MQNQTNLISQISEKLLMGPGPSMVAPEIYKAISMPTLGHLDPQFIAIMEEIKQMIRDILNTKNSLTLPISGTGSAGMEACFVNLILPEDEVLILSNGVFGSRMQDVAARLRAKVDVVEAPWGTPILVEEVAKKLKQKTYKIVAIVHAETSTGVRNPVKEIGELLKGSDTIYLVDAVTSMGGIEILADEWGIDALYSGTQKCLACPPGLSPVTFSEKAVNVIKNRKEKVPNWYLDLSMIIAYWEGNSRAYHHTAPINMLYALHQALVLVLNEGKEAVYNRHQEVHKYLVAGLEQMGLKMLVDRHNRLPMLNSVLIPHGVDEAAIRKTLLNKYRIEIGGGLGSLSGKIWRIGTMGHTARRENIDQLLKALGDIL
jgi:alanine-glyoxylate transaminase/serine-glyoxylate transaminase/serine-pyruvate transaminase